MRIITGDECGLIKECVPELSRRNKNADDTARNNVTVDEGIQRIDATEPISRSRGVVDMAFTSNLENSNSFAALRMDGSIDFYQDDDNKEEEANGFELYRQVETTRNVFANKDDSSSSTEKNGRPLTLVCWNKQQEDSLLCAANSLGQLTLLKDTGSIVAQYDGVSQRKQSNSSYSKVQFGYENDVVSAMACDPNTLGRIAMGGRDRETTILDLESDAKVVWKAKNLPPHPQTLLQHPIWTTTLIFWNSTANLLAVGTAYKQVRLYDVRSTTRRPIAYTQEDVLDHRVTALCQICDNGLVIGDAAGGLHEFDIRQVKSNSKSLGRYVGPHGSIRQIAKHPTLPVMGVVGLDRMLRTYDTNSRKQIDCVYLKQRLNCLLMSHDDYTEQSHDETDIYQQQDSVQDYVDSDMESDGNNNEQSSSSEEDATSANSSSNEESGSSDDDDDESDEEEMSRGPNKRRKR